MTDTTPVAYGVRHAGKRTVVAAIHRDAFEALEAFREAHNLTRSGAAHHLLRVALQLPPLEPFN